MKLLIFCYRLLLISLSIFFGSRIWDIDWILIYDDRVVRRKSIGGLDKKGRGVD